MGRDHPPWYTRPRLGGVIIAKLGIEADGRMWHSGRADFTRDRHRANAWPAWAGPFSATGGPTSSAPGSGPEVEILLRRRAG